MCLLQSNTLNANNFAFCLKFGPRVNSCSAQISIYNHKISWVDNTKYLGVLFSKCKKFFCDWHPNICNFYKALNAIMGKIGSCKDTGLILNLFRKICIPILMYGVTAINLSAKDIKKFNFAYNCVFSKLFNIKDQFSIEMCQFYCNFLPFQYLYDCCRVTFLSNSLKLCRGINPLIINDSRSLDNLALKYGFAINSSISFKKFQIWNAFKSVLVI